MNTREPTGLIVLQVGYRAGIPAGPVLLAFVIMALATTACTGPASRPIGLWPDAPRSRPVSDEWSTTVPEFEAWT